MAAAPDGGAPPRREHFDVCGTATMRQLERYLIDLGYVHGPCSDPGQFSAYPSDGAPGWSDWMYEVAITLLPGHDLGRLLQGFHPTD